MVRVGELYAEAEQTDGSPEMLRHLLRGIHAYSPAVKDMILTGMDEPPESENAAKLLGILAWRAYIDLKEELGNGLDLSRLEYFAYGVSRPTASGEALGSYAFARAECPVAVKCTFGSDAFNGARSPIVLGGELGFGSFVHTTGEARVFADSCESIIEPGAGVYVFRKLGESVLLESNYEYSIADNPRSPYIFYNNTEDDSKDPDGSMQVSKSSMAPFGRLARKAEKEYMKEGGKSWRELKKRFNEVALPFVANNILDSMYMYRRWLPNYLAR